MSVQNSINLSPKTLQGELANQPLNPPALKNQALSTPALQTPALNEEQNTEQNEEQSDLVSLHPASPALQTAPQEQTSTPQNSSQNTPQEQTNPDEKPALLLAFDFDKALNAGFSKEEIMKHLQSKQSEINWEDLNKKSVDEGFEMLKKQGFQTPNFKTYARAENEEEKAALSWLNPANFNAAKLKHEEAKARKNEVDTQNADLKAQVANIAKEKQDENPLLKAGKELSSAILGVDFDEDKKKKLDAYTSALIAANVPFEALDEETKALLAWQKTQNDASDLFSLHRFSEGLSENLKQSFSQKDEAKLLQEAALTQFNHLKTLNEAYQKNAFEDLSEAEKAAIDKERGLFSSIWDKTGHQLFGDDEERFLDEKKDFEARFAVSDELRSAVVRLGENSSYKALIIGGKNEKDKADFERDFKRVAEFAGFDEALVDEGSGELYVKKGEHIYRVNDNFGANFMSFIEANQLSLGGSLAGAWLGFQKGKGLKDAVRKSIAGAAAGSMLGKMGDVALTNYAYDKEHKLDEYLALATQEGILSLVGDAVIVNAKPLLKGVATSVSKVVEYVPVLNFTKSIPTQNFKAAKDLVAQSVDEGTRAQLQSFYKEFGGDLNAKQGKTLGEFASFLAQRYGSDHALTKHTQKLSEILNLNSLTTRQQELFKAIRADESGFLLPYIKEVASLDSKANESLKGILNATTARLESSLNALNINKSDIKTLLDDLHKGTKEDFARVSDTIINKLYDAKTYTTTLDKTKFEALKNELESTGALGENELLFLKDIQKNVFDEKGVSFKQLNNARINLNEFLRKASTPSSKNFFKSEAINTLKDEIAKGINQIFSQNKTAYTKVSALYNTALQEYAQMSELLKQSAFKKARDEKQSLDEALDSLIKYAKGQGDGKNNNLDFLRSKLDAPNTAILEMNLLKRFFEKSLASTDESLRVLDSAKFMNELAKLQNFTFQSKEAKEFIKLSQGFHTLFKNDASLAEDLLSKTARKEGSALATSISGAYAQKLVKGLFDFTFRNLPQSFMFGFFKNSIQGAALRHHLRHALQKSVSVDEFNHTLKHSLSKSQFNSQTRKLADELMSELEQTSKALDEEARLMSKSLEEKSEQKEARGLYNVVYNDKFSTQIKKDLQSADYLATLSKGFHFKRGGKGARHIKLKHTIDSTQEGFVTPQEVASLGVKMREFLQKHKEPFLSDQGGKKAFIYEWQDEKGVRFRLVSTANATELQPAPPSTKEELTDEIITFYSDRNLKEPMKFKNPALQADEMSEALSNEALDEEAWLMSKSLEEKRGQREALTQNENMLKNSQNFNISQDLEHAWLKEFNLKSLDEDFIPTLPKELEGLFDGGVHLKSGSLVKLSARDRAEFIAKIRPTLESADALIRQNDGAYIFVKDFNEEKFFTSVVRDENGEWIVRSNAPKTLNNIMNKIKEGGEVVFNKSLPELPIIAKPELPAKALSSEGVDEFNSTTNKTLSQAQNPQKNLSLFEKALLEKEELIASKKAEALRQEKEAKEQLKRLEAQQQALRAQKDARAGLGVNENVSFTQGASIHATPLKDTTIIIDDESLPLKATYMVIDKKDIKPSFERAGVQGRSTKQDAVIKNIQEDFKPSLIFDKEGSFDGVPIITKDGQVVVGNHRSEAMNALNKEARKAYEQAVEAKFNIKLKDNEIIVRKLDENTDTKDILRLAFASNAGRESNFGEKALANLARFEKDIENLPNFLNASSVDEMSFLIAKHLDKQGKGLDSFNANLALFANLAKNSKNNDILEGLNEALKHLDAQSKNKILKMYVENAGAFYNIAKDTDLKELDLRNFLADAFVASAKANQTRSEDFKALLESLEHYTSLTAEARKQFDELHPNFTQDIKAQALGLALARFARLENPSASLFEFLHSAKARLEELIAPNLFDPNGKSLSEANMNDFLKLILAEGQENKDKPALLNALTKLDELETAKRAVSFEDLSKLNEDFGTNYAEFYHKPIEAFHKLKSEQSGQVAGAFERKDLGDIDLVWGEVWRDEKGQIQGFGLSKILQKHPEITAELLADIVENGSLKKQVNEAMQVIKDNYKIVLKSNWKGKPSNKWIVTAYEVEEKGSSISSKPLTKGDNLPLNSSANSTTKELKSQAKLTDSKEYNELINDFINRHPTPLRHTREEIYPKDILNDETLYKEYTEDLQRYIDRELERNFMSKQARIDTMELRTLQVLKQLKEGKPLNPLLRDDEILDLGISLFQVRQMQEELAQKGFHIELAPEVKARLELADQGYEDALYYPSKHTLEVQAHKAEQKQAQDLTHSKDMLKNSQNFNISSALKDLPAENTPLKLDEKELDELLQRFDNVENIKEHLSTRADSEQRKALFNLLDSTLENPHFQYIKDGKDKFLKKFKSSGKEPFFYLLITKDGNKNFITHLKTRDYAYLEKELNKADELVKGADIIEGLRQQAGASKEAINPQPPKANSTTNKTLSQESTKKEFKTKANLEAELKAKKEELLELKTQVKALKSKDDNHEYFERLKNFALKDDLSDFVIKTNTAFTDEQSELLLALNKAFREVEELKNTLENYPLNYVKKAKAFFEGKEYDLYSSALTLKHSYEKIIDTPQNKQRFTHVRQALEKEFNINPIKEFGTNYAEFYHDGVRAVKKLLAEKQGQVVGAFYRDETGDITLAWGEVGTAKSDGWGLAKIEKYHPEVLDRLEEIITKGKFYIDEKGRPNIKLGNEIVGLRDNWKGEKTPYWVISSYQKSDELTKGINSSKNIASSKEDYSFATHQDNSTTNKTLSQDEPKLHSNTHLGSGLFTGSVAGIEEDEQGNLSFDPAQFVAGFLGGAGASKLMSSKVVQDRALTFVKNISKEYENLSAQKPKLFATILQKMDIKTMIGNTDKAKEQARKLFNEELFKRVKNAIDNDEITIMPKSEFKNEEEFKALFDRIDGKFGYIDTPYKSVKVNTHYAFTHFRKNTYDTNRENIKGGFFESFKEPLFVVEHKRDGASEPSVYFYKPFYDKEKQLLNLFGIGVNERGFLNFKTYYLDKQGSRLKSLMKDRNLIIKYMK